MHYKHESKRTFDLAVDAVKNLGRATKKQILLFIKSNADNYNEKNLGSDLSLVSVNSPSRVHYHQNQQPRRTIPPSEYDALFKEGQGRDATYVLYDPTIHGEWEITPSLDVRRVKYEKDLDVAIPVVETREVGLSPLCSTEPRKSSRTMLSGMLCASDYAALLEKCRNLAPPRGEYVVQDFISIVIVTVLDFQLKNVVVKSAHDHYVRNHSSKISTIYDLEELLSQYPNDEQGNTEAAIALWGYKLWTRLECLRRLIAFFIKNEIKDSDSLKNWATQADFRGDFEGKVKGLGQAVFNWLVMRAGVETIKPDVHVLNFIESAIGYQPDFNTAVQSLIKIAGEIGRTPRELDLAIWEHQRGSPGQI